MDTLDIKIENFCVTKDTINKVNKSITVNEPEGMNKTHITNVYMGDQKC